MMSPGNDDELDRAVRMVWAAFGRKADSDTCAVWAKSLRPLVSAALWRVLKEAAEGEHLPNLGDIIAKVRAIQLAARGAELHVLTPEERRRADKAAVLSMLWLHYAKGWPLTTFAGHVLGKQYQGDVVKALQVAAEIYDRDLVLRWMQDQQRAGN